MATGTYGVNRGADVTPNDVEIFVHYTPSRNVVGEPTLTKLNPVEVLIPLDNPNKTDSGIASGDLEIFGGMYTLKLPVQDFSEKGIYTIMIKPIEIRLRIEDCGVLSAYPDVKGLVFDLARVPADFIERFENSGLVGYRIEYLTPTKTGKVSNFFRIITSNNRAEAVNQNLTNSSQKAIRYRYNDNANFTFCTVSPSSAGNTTPNILPFIGEPLQEVIITNTFFNPLMVEIEMVEHDIETLAYSLYGNQTKSLEDGIYTIYNFENEIYKQFNLFEIKDRFNGKPLFEVKEERDVIDFTKGFDDIANV
jgi:hypothetical protein